MNRAPFGPSVTFVVGALVVACSGDAAQCARDADCESGMCTSAGSCAVAAPAPSSPAPGSPSDPAHPAPPPPATTSEDPPAPASCTPNADTKISHAEVPARAGVQATYVVARDVSVDLVGQTKPNGTRAWRLDDPKWPSSKVKIELRAPSTSWFGATLPGASYVSDVPGNPDVVGVYESGAQGLLLRGVASPKQGAARTELRFDPPPKLLAFPLETSATWSTTSSVSGLVNGIASAYTETYSASVDATGTLTTTYGELSVVRVRVDLKRTVGFAYATQRTFMFVSECLGVVGLVVSNWGDEALEPTEASEVRALAP